MNLRAWIWHTVGARLFRWSPHVAHGLRRAVLRLFGADISPQTKIRRSVMIDRPWNLTAGALTIFGDEAVLRCCEPLTVGARCVISQHAIVTTEMRDPASGRTTSAPIVLKDDVWIATDTLVLPGVTVNAGTVVGARSLVCEDLPEWSVCVGEPARPRGERVMFPVGDTA